MSPLYTDNPLLRQGTGAQGWIKAVVSSSTSVNGGIEGGIVVHLQLPIELETAGSGQGIAPEGIEAARQVVALFLRMASRS